MIKLRCRTSDTPHDRASRFNPKGKSSPIFYAKHTRRHMGPRQQDSEMFQGEQDGQGWHEFMAYGLP